MTSTRSLALLISLAAFITLGATAASATTTRPGRVTLKTTLENPNVLISGNGIVHIAIDLEARGDSRHERLPMNVALVIDRSGSMRGDKLRNTLAAARHFVGMLNDRDRLAIISYADEVRVDMASARVSGRIRQRALNALRHIRAAGSTNLSGGLFRGQDEVERGLQTGKVNRVILMSDGLANRGITDTKSLTRRVQAASQRGISVTTMGVGTDYNEDMMTAIADHSGGNYYFIQRAGDVATVFDAELKKMSGTVAQATEIELRLEDGVAMSQVFGYTYRRRGELVTIPLAEMYGGQRRSILVALSVPTRRVGQVPLARVTLRYDDAMDDGRLTRSMLDLSVNVTRDSARVNRTRNRTVEERIEELQVSHVMHRAAELLKEGRGEDARRIIQAQRRQTATKSRAMGGSSRLRGQVKALDAMDENFEKAAAEPAAAAGRVKAAKERARKLAR